MSNGSSYVTPPNQHCIKRWYNFPNSIIWGWNGGKIFLTCQFHWELWVSVLNNHMLITKLLAWQLWGYPFCSFKAAVGSQQSLGWLSYRRRQRGTFQQLLLFFFEVLKVLNLCGVLFPDENVLSIALLDIYDKYHVLSLFFMFFLMPF